MDSYLTLLTVISMLRLHNLVLFPRGIHISDTNQICVIQPRMQSLYEVVHAAPDHKKELSQYCKINILIQLAKVLNTFH